MTDAPPENRLLAQTESVAGATTRTWAYRYDPADRLTEALADPGSAYAYSLDATDNLLEQQTPAGTASSTYNALNQIAQRNAHAFVHDAAGNLTDDGARTYAYDAEQRLVRIGHTGTGRSTSLRYDAFGRRTAVIETDGTSSIETRYLWCGERICQARDATDTVTRRYYDEGELAVSATGDIATFYAEDHLGSVRDLRMGDGQVLASYDYDPYGAPTHSSETGGVTADYRYAGLVQHAPSGLYLANYRAYSSATGRWVTRDPIGEAGGSNLYTYVRNNPINRIDPLGLSDVTYDRGNGTITVYDNQGNQVRQFPAGNNTTSTSNGPWPNGTFPYSHYVPHPESGPTGPYGSNGNFVFDVPGRTGMGIHSGRSGPQSKTLGCIRTTDDATDFLRNLHQSDPLRTITVQ